MYFPIDVVAESGLLSDVAYVMCLDSIGTGSDLFVHVSKPPKNDSAVDFVLKVRRPSCHPSVTFATKNL